MAEDIRDLIEKINEEGIRAAEEKARGIEDAAGKKAQEILASAQRSAEELVAAANERIRQEDERERILLAQAGRDLLLSLREEITLMLGRIVLSDVREALTPGDLTLLIAEAVRHQTGQETGSITVAISSSDLEKLDRHFFGELSEEVHREIVLKPADTLSGGFTISFDREKSCFDYSDRALADYIGTYLKPKLHRVLQSSMKE